VLVKAFGLQYAPDALREILIFEVDVLNRRVFLDAIAVDLVLTGPANSQSFAISALELRQTGVKAEDLQNSKSDSWLHLFGLHCSEKHLRLRHIAKPQGLGG
jgi:hypothetical protein